MSVKRVFIGYDDKDKSLTFIVEALMHYLPMFDGYEDKEILEEKGAVARGEITTRDAIIFIRLITFSDRDKSRGNRPWSATVESLVPAAVPIVWILIDPLGGASVDLQQNSDSKSTEGDNLLADVQTVLSFLPDLTTTETAAPKPEASVDAKTPTKSAEESRSSIAPGAVAEARRQIKLFGAPAADALDATSLSQARPSLAFVPRAQPQTQSEPLPDDEVRFTAFRPERVIVEQWQTLLVYAHLESALETVRADAKLSAEKMGGVPKETQSKASAKLARGTEIKIMPRCEGVTFNPESVTLKWLEDLHRADFRFRAEASLAGTDDLALVDIYVGPLIVGQVKLAMSFESAPPPAINPINAIVNRVKNSRLPQSVPITASMYRQDQIFVSYSHADTSVAVRFRNACKALGFEVLIDIDTLRAGEVWNEALMRMIDQADLFQLFWSERAANSPYVRQEWQYARELQKKQIKPVDFIRPVHWESPNPMPPPPDELSDLHFAYVPLSE